MNEKYASKPNLNPNEANAAWPKLPASGWHLQAQLVGGVVSPADQAVHTFLSRHSLDDGGCLSPFFSGLLPLVSCLFGKTNPIFSRPNMRYQYQKRRNGDQKTTQKNETNPFVDNFSSTLNAVC